MKTVSEIDCSRMARLVSTHSGAGWTRVVLVAALLTLVAGCAQDTSSKMQVTVTTAHMRSVVQAVGGESVEVLALVPPGSCPGHYDVRPGDAQAIARSEAMFIHGYEAFVPNLLNAVGKQKLIVYKIDVQENWLVPGVQTEAVQEVALRLSELDPEHRGYYGRQTVDLLERTQKVGDQLLARCRGAGLGGYPVICSDQQASVLEWMGFDVVGVYGRAEEFTPELLHKLTKEAKERKVRLVVDNLQSGAKAGLQFSREIGAAHVTLSNFPGGFPETDTWEACLRDNVERVLSALDVE